MNDVVKVSAILGFVFAGFVILSAAFDQVIVLPFALIPLAAGVGIMRRRVWSAWGWALFVSLQLLLMPVAVARSAMSLSLTLTVIFAVPANIGIAGVSLLAGRSLQKSGATRGVAWPWIVVSLATTMPLFFLQAFAIPTGAMENTLLVGDRVLVQRWPRPRPVRDGMIVFLYPEDPHQTFIKRVIGAPGDRIRIADKTVYRNGAPLSEPYAVHKTDYVESYRDNFPSEPTTAIPPGGLAMLDQHVEHGEVVVPPDEWFVLGDNRDFSFDSRYWGFVSSKDLVGRPLLIYGSVEQTAEERASGRRWGLWHVRWKRLLKLLN